MRHDRLYLADIVAAADALARFIADMKDDSDFFTDELRQSAILQKLIVIGEAASRVVMDYVHHIMRWNGLILWAFATLPAMRLFAGTVKLKRAEVECGAGGEVPTIVAVMHHFVDHQQVHDMEAIARQQTPVEIPAKGFGA